ncbi:MAG TPA: alpha/beta hydrolase, partial [Nitrospira sp.]|nr:alpha/beta hydrolase [Nitrospira sp.]
MHTFKWLIGALVVFAIIGIGYQFTGMLLDRLHYPPPGQMIDVGGYRLHLNCTGKGSPTILLEAPAPGWSLYWALVQAQVETVTRVCAYDRAGLGWSDPGPLPRNGHRMATELHRLLDRGDVPGPYILVGHSFGGLVARIYRQEHRKDVVAMVLVDAGHELELRQAEFRTFVNAGKSTMPLLHAMTILGLSRVFASFDSLPVLLKQHKDKAPEKIRPMLRAGWL